MERKGCDQCKSAMIQGVYCHEIGCPNQGQPPVPYTFNDRIESVRMESGELPSYAWPGGYPIFYLCEDNGVLCPECANNEGDPDDEQWNLVAVDVNWEDENLYCDHCGKLIESAYGDDSE